MRIVLVVVLVAVIAGVAAWTLQRRLIYLPDTSVPPAAATVLPGAEDVVLTTSDGLELGAWFVPGRNPTGPGADFTVLLAPGNGGNRLGRAETAADLAAAGFSTLLFDYRGYGGNPGRPSEDGVARDARAALQYLRGRQDVEPDRVLYFGESLGCAVVTALAAESPPAGMLLRSPFTDLGSVARHHYRIVPDILLKDRFPVADIVAGLHVPITVVYGTADRIVPAAQSAAVADSAPNLVEIVELHGVEHNDPPMFGAPVVDALGRLADAVR
ncbi:MULTISPECIES: alpha/beta fold hydrolase [unclassified Rhodococcus (in: high G+C Gram-positive bacteria)]|uniref:alpha/beta hydrolase n=1 Tax=Rhodococcus sp. SJ-3 TaxID=3454628 RepID=UPI002DB427FD|nr:alpha/beta hydrolase [Rhodococcus sp. (in: high G+C Gram-positive bacteria)]